MEVECACGEYHDTKCPVAKALRNCWCTPKWLADLIGWVDLDPCTNGRSHIRSRIQYDEVQDGLACTAPPDWRVFINPPYGNGQVIRWVQRYRHTRFIYLLRWDPSTKWFGELLPHCTHVWFPPSRVDFEPPPRIHESSNPYPHALYLRDPPEDLIDRLNKAGYLFTCDGHQQVGNEDGERGHGACGGSDDRGRTKGAGGAGERHEVGPSWVVPPKAA